MRFIKLFLLFFILSGVGFAQDSEKKIYKATVDADGIQRVDISGGEYFFSPNYIIVKVNMPVELTAKKEASIVPHNIVINAPEAEIDIKESLGTEPKVLKFTPKKIGKYPIYCDKKLLFFKGHRERGMEGTLEVTE